MNDRIREAVQKRAAVEALPHYVYQLWNEAGECVYVGMSRHPGNRLAQHMQRQWWHQVATFSATRYANRHQARQVEADLISDLDPHLNWMHSEKAAGSRSGGGHGYVAFRKSEMVDDR